MTIGRRRVNARMEDRRMWMLNPKKIQTQFFGGGGIINDKPCICKIPFEMPEPSVFCKKKIQSVENNAIGNAHQTGAVDYDIKLLRVVFRKNDTALFFREGHFF